MLRFTVFLLLACATPVWTAGDDRELTALRDRVEAFLAPPSAQPQLKDKRWVRERIQEMVDIDQAVREATIKQPHELAKLMGRIDSANTAELKGMLKIYHWFTISEFGKETDHNAWLLVQHADHDRAFQQTVLDVLTELYPKQETSPSNYAYLWDRVASGAKRKQRYGTQGRCAGTGAWEPGEMEEPALVDERRRSVGLIPMAQYRQVFKTRGLCP